MEGGRAEKELTFTCVFCVGVPTHLLINITNLTPPGRLTHLELLNLHADVLLEVPIVYNGSNPFLYNVSAFMPPNNFFFLKVCASFLRT